MNISKIEYFALEILKHRDVSVDEAWEMAAELAKKIKMQSQLEHHMVSVDTDTITSVGVDVTLDSTDFIDRKKLADLDVLMQKDRKIELGQSWYNWWIGYSLKTDDIVRSNLNSGWCPKGVKPCDWDGSLDSLTADEIYDLGRSKFEHIAPQPDGHESEVFSRNGWEWVLMKEGESIPELLNRMNAERTAIAECQELQQNIFDMGQTSVRTNNALQAIKTHTFADLLVKSEGEVFKIRNLGKKCVIELQALLKDNGLYFGMLKKYQPR